MGQLPTDQTADAPTTDQPTTDHRIMTDGGEPDELDLSGVHAARVKYVKAVSDGCETPQEVADETGKNYSNVCEQLRKCNENPENPVVGEKSGGWEFWIAEPGSPSPDTADESPDTDTTDPQESDGKIPVDRNYDWDKHVPEPGTEYIGGMEYDRLRAEISEPARTRTDEPFSARLVGPTASGKTLLVESLAAEKDIPVFTLQINPDMQGSDLIGYPVQSADGTLKFHDGTLTKALLCSQERPTILLIDEVNRAPNGAKSVIFPALDSRCQVSLDMRDGEVVKGDADNLMAFSTMNQGRDYAVEPMHDVAEVRRLGGVEKIDYIGRESPEKEVRIISDGLPVSDRYAELVVEAANDVRDTAEEKGGVLATPTPALEALCNDAAAYKRNDLPNPSEMAVDRLIRTHYAESREKDLVRTTYMNRLRSVDPIDTESPDHVGAGSGTDSGLICADGADPGVTPHVETDGFVDGLRFDDEPGVLLKATDDGPHDSTYPVKDCIKTAESSEYHGDIEKWSVAADEALEALKRVSSELGTPVRVRGDIVADDRTDINGGDI